MRTPALLILQAIFLCAAIAPALARQAGPFAACKVDVEGGRLSLSVGPAPELGAAGEDICLQFVTDIHDALEGGQVAEDDVEVDGGDGFTVDTRFDIGARLEGDNPMVPVLRHSRGVAAGRFVYFMLISMADDLYVVEVAPSSAEGTIRTIYYEYTAWVLPRLQLE